MDTTTQAWKQNIEERLSFLEKFIAAIQDDVEKRILSGMDLPGLTARIAKLESFAYNTQTTVDTSNESISSKWQKKITEQLTNLEQQAVELRDEVNEMQVQRSSIFAQLNTRVEQLECRES